MRTRVFLSCSRHCEEKKILKEYISKKFDVFEDVYDCEDTPTLIDENPKQKIINDKEIAASNWFVLICPIGWVGLHTFEEFKAALCHQKCNGYPKITIFGCENPEDQRTKLNIEQFQPEKTYSVNYMLEYAKQFYKTDISNYVVDYKFINEDNSEYLSFEVVARKELEKLERSFEHIFLKTSIPEHFIASDFFYDSNRIIPKNGYYDDKYVNIIDDKISFSFRSNTVVIIHGRPASGKSRAAFEYLRSLKMQRIYSVRTDKEFTWIVRFVNENIDKLSEIKNLQQIIVACDQLDTLLRYNESSHKAIRKFFMNLQKLEWKFLATCSELGYGTIKEILSADISWSGIDIPPMSPAVLDMFYKLGIVVNGTVFNDNMVLGEYINGFNGYQDSVIANLQHIQDDSKTLFNDFFKSIQVLKVFRHIDHMPLCLVVMMMYENFKHTQLEFEKFCSSLKALLVSLTSTSIISIRKEHSYDDVEDDPFAEYSNDDTGIIDIVDLSIVKDQVREYDKENMKTLVDTDIVIRVENDYIYEKIISGALNVFNEDLYLNINNVNERRMAMAWFYNTFSSEQMVSTLRRILVRNPVTNFKNKYDCNLQQNLDFVLVKLGEYFKHPTTKADDNLNDLVSLCIGRFNSYEEIYKKLTQFIAIGEKNGKFRPNYVTVGEILGAASRKSGQQRENLINLAHKLIKQYVDEEYLPMYILQRELYLKKSVDEAFEYIQRNIKSFDYIISNYNNENTDQDSRKFIEYHFSKIKNNLISKICSSSDLSKVVSYIESNGVDYSQIIQLIRQAEAFFNWSSRRLYLDKIWNYLSDNTTKANTILNERFIAILYHILDNTKQYIQAKDIYEKALVYAENNGLILKQLERLKLINTCCNQCRNFEYLILYNDFFKDGKLKEDFKDISLILRNTILKTAPTFTDSMTLLPMLFDGIVYKPDVYTVTAVSSMISENNKKRLNSTKYGNIDNCKSNKKNDSLENIIEIFHTKLFDNVDFGEYMLFGTFLENCKTFEQLQELKIMMDKRFKEDKSSIKWGDLMKKPEIVGTLINSNILSLENAWEYIDGLSLSAYNEIVPDPLSSFAKLLVSRSEDKNFTLYKEKLRAFIDDNWSKILRDSFFYKSYFRLYPESLLIIDDNGEYEVSYKLTSLDSILFDGGVVSKTLSGALHMPEPQKAFECVQQWWIDNYPEIIANSYILNEVESKLGKDYCVKISHLNNNHGRKNNQFEGRQPINTFSLKKYFIDENTSFRSLENNVENILSDISKLENIPFPTISSIHELLKQPTKKEIKVFYTPSQLIKIMNAIFKDRKYEVMPSVISSFLQGIKNYVLYSEDTTEGTTRLQKANKAMELISREGILENSCINDGLILQEIIEICPYDYKSGDKYVLREKLDIVESFPFRGINLLSALIGKGLKVNMLLANDFNRTARYILEYNRLSKLLSSTHGEGSAGFLRILFTRKTYPVIDSQEKVQAIYHLLESLEDRNIKFLKNALNNRNKKVSAIEWLKSCSGYIIDDEHKNRFESLLQKLR